MTTSGSAAAIAVGDEIGTFTRTTGLANWNRYAAVNDEFVPIHMDDAAGQAAGYPGAFGMGNLQWAYLHNLIRQWLPDAGRILKVSCRFQLPNNKGQVVTAKGKVSAVRIENGRQIVELEVLTEDQDGNPLAPGKATVSVPA